MPVKHSSLDIRIKELVNKANSNIIRSLCEITDPSNMSIETTKCSSYLLIFDGHGKAGIIMENNTLKLFKEDFFLSRGRDTSGTMEYIDAMHLLSPEEFNELTELLK